MRVTDLLDNPLPLMIGGRRFIMRRISLRAVLRILVRFQDELNAFAASETQDTTALLSSIENESLADLFAILLDPYDPEHLRKSMDFAVASELIALVSHTNDLRRIWASLNFVRPPQAAPPADEKGGAVPVPALLSVLDIVAQRYHQDPLALLDWPYEAFLTITELLDATTAETNKANLRGLLSSMGLSPDLADIPGVEYCPVPTGYKEH